MELTVSFPDILKTSCCTVLIQGSPLLVAWKYPKDAKRAHDLLALLTDVRTVLTDDRFIVTVVLPASPSVLQFIDLEAIAKYVDHINLVAYDLCGIWSPATGHHAQLYAMKKDESSGSAGVGFLISRGIPPKKILLGIPTHGRSFLSAAGPGQSFRGGGGKAGSFPYSQLPRPGSKEAVDKRYVAAQCLGGDGGFVTYDNAETAKTKAEFVKQKGLAVCVLNLTQIPCMAVLLSTTRAYFIATLQLIPETSQGVSSRQDSADYTLHKKWHSAELQHRLQEDERAICRYTKGSRSITSITTLHRISKHQH